MHFVPITRNQGEGCVVHFFIIVYEKNGIINLENSHLLCSDVY